MIVSSVILEKFKNIDRCLARIRQKVGGDPARLEDLDSQEICVLNLQRATQLAIDVAALVIKERGLELPETLRGTFEILGKEGIISPDLAAKLARMVGFRNIVVHDYSRLDVAVLKAVVERHLDDFVVFQKELLRG